MNIPAIRVENLGKHYRIGVAAKRHDTLRGAIVHAATSPFRNLRRLRQLTAAPGRGDRPDVVWALRDVSFDVEQGEVLGIIGRNGAGKSTLLKVLSRITEPSAGRAEMYGRAGSLLEVGTGFHPELTGRDNIYLNGSILGMDRASIARRFDEIVAFSGVEKFIDTPVKRYSSGMYLRLAFAVAAHLEPEILIVDEVLAVGDADFQRKCLDKMQEVGRGGRTVLFVSHNMPAVTRLCSRAILLDRGRVVRDGSAPQVVQRYLRSGLNTTAAHQWDDPATAPGNDVVRLRAVRVRDADGQVTETFDIRRPIDVEIEYEVIQPGHVLLPNVHLFNEEEICAFCSIDTDPTWHHRPRPAGRYVSTMRIPGNLLTEGTIYVKIAITTHSPHVIHLSERDVAAFNVVDSMEGDSARGEFHGHIVGVVRPLLPWSTRLISDGSAADAETAALRSP